MHPALSFAAWGQYAGVVTAGHSLDYGLGEGSPLARVYELDGHVLLLGVGHDRNTSFHLAEYRAGGSPATTEVAAILEDGRRVWREYRDIALDSERFAVLGSDFETTGAVRRGRVGQAEARLFRQRAAVDYAVGLLERGRATS
jgi:aminoglycoside 3-N-acetyltransferase